MKSRDASPQSTLAPLNCAPTSRCYGELGAGRKIWLRWPKSCIGTIILDRTEFWQNEAKKINLFRETALSRSMHQSNPPGPGGGGTGAAMFTVHWERRTRGAPPCTSPADRRAFCRREAHCNLANALRGPGWTRRSRQAIGIKADLGVALRDQGKRDEAIAAFRQAISIKPDYAEAHSNLLLGLN
jgi:hypothetical protein